MDYEAIFKHAAQALANFEIPDFDNFSEDDVFDAFNEVKRGDEYDEWFSFMQEEISRISSNSACLIETSFYTGIKGINHQFILKKDNKEQKVIVSLSVPPISFVG